MSGLGRIVKIWMRIRSRVESKGISKMTVSFT